MITAEQAIKRVEAIIQRINHVIQTTAENGIYFEDENSFGESKALIFAAKSVCQKILGDHSSPYALFLNDIELLSDGNMTEARENRATMVSLMHVLGNIKEEIAEGLLASVIGQVQAGIFDDFIDHAENYLASNRKNEAGVIAGVTFEDTVRKLCAKHSIVEKGKKLNFLIDELAKKNVLSGLEAKRARVGADVRTKATHAQWDEVDEGAVRDLVGFLRSNIILKLGA